jgi:geranylgeranyl pyrophosphate synthase
LGVAFQILNDLNDWEGDDFNKLAAGGDVLGGRPTILWALALEGLPPTQQEELLAGVNPNSNTRLPPPDARLARIRDLYNQAGVFDKAHRLVDKHRERAEKIADEVEPEELRALLYYLIDSVLDHAPPEPEVLTTIE